MKCKLCNSKDVDEGVLLCSKCEALKESLVGYIHNSLTGGEMLARIIYEAGVTVDKFKNYSTLVPVIKTNVLSNDLLSRDPLLIGATWKNSKRFCIAKLPTGYGLFDGTSFLCGPSPEKEIILFNTAQDLLTVVSGYDDVKFHVFSQHSEVKKWVKEN